MTDPIFYLTMAGAGLAALSMLAITALTGWRGWLALKAQQLAQQASGATPTMAGTGARIEIADLRERIRKLEAIAAGVDL